MSIEQHRLLHQYKEVIREQDQQLGIFRRELALLKEEHSRIVMSYQEQSASIQQLRDQNALLKAQKSASSLSSVNAQSEHDNASIDRSQLQDVNESLMQQIGVKDSHINELVSPIIE